MLCWQAAKDGLKYAWVDTCCIDKSSSAELSEAINSMFRWYQRSARCYVYLSDIRSGPSWRDELARCRWFTRGWTLQELLAPRQIHFFDQDWKYLCMKIEIIKEISTITGIDEAILEQRRPLSMVPVVQRMSWASSRHTTRIEDEAYCLMGIFDVNMPLLYGEEERAFLRLQEEIINTTSDLTILAWTHPAPEIPLQRQATSHSGFLAESPRSFGHLGRLEADPLQRVTRFSTSNKLIKITARMSVQQLPDGQGGRMVLPVCSSGDGRVFGIHMRKSREDGSFLRQNPYMLIPMDISDNIIMIRATTPKTLLAALPAWEHECWRSRAWAISENFLNTRRFHLCQVQIPPYDMEHRSPYPWPELLWDGDIQAFFVDSTSCYAEGTATVVPFTARVLGVQLKLTLIILGWDTLEQNTLQFSLVQMNQRVDDHLLTTLTRSYRGYRHIDASTLKKNLQKAKIPRKATISHRIVGSNLHALVVATPTIVEDDSLCQNPFCRFTLSSRLCSGAVPPRIEEFEWE
ncbi:Vegetative incompatibility protein HET-E-1 [Cytospora mali]|uniref:Vegetative incompatibility protein HET-E-1 n=1 Tax=Cytospora mali TaxID=578113 RepID=A0A194V6R2_CYTMA|nr:Vegetative incompatibility protein HET-E-1 [Valsa mali var. pyri (nom. inval.)]